MNNANTEVHSFRELSIEEIEAVSGGVKWTCKATRKPNGDVEISCEISGEF